MEMNIKEECLKAGISVAAYYFRRKKGLSHDDALKVPARKMKGAIPPPTHTAGQENKSRGETPEAVFALFEKNGKLMGIYNGAITNEELLRVATHLTSEALNILKAATGHGV